MSCLARLRPVWTIVVCLVPWLSPATAAARPDGSPATSSVTSAPTVHGRRKSKKRRKNGNAGKVASHTPGRSAALTHRRERHRLGSPSPTKPATKVALLTSPGPAQTPAALRAMDDVRHL